MAILKILEEEGDFFKDPNMHKIAEFALIAVNPIHSGKGIAKKLAEVSRLDLHYIYFLDLF